MNGNLQNRILYTFDDSASFVSNLVIKFLLKLSSIKRIKKGDDNP